MRAQGELPACEGEGPGGGRDGVEGKGEAGAKGRGVGKGMRREGVGCTWNFNPLGEEKRLRVAAASGGVKGSCVRPKSSSKEAPRAF